jgi:hypothetical protein
MAGKKGSRWHQTTRLSSPTNLEELRRLIDAKTIAQTLKDHVLGRKNMTTSQVNAALGLLRKLMPDLQAVELSNDPDNPIGPTLDTILGRLPPAWIDAGTSEGTTPSNLPVTH